MSWQDDEKLRQWSLEQATAIYRHETPDAIVQAAEKFYQYARKIEIPKSEAP